MAHSKINEAQVSIKAIQKKVDKVENKVDKVVDKVDKVELKVDKVDLKMAIIISLLKKAEIEKKDLQNADVLGRKAENEKIL